MAHGVYFASSTTHAKCSKELKRLICCTGNVPTTTIYSLEVVTSETLCISLCCSWYLSGIYLLWLCVKACNWSDSSKDGGWPPFWQGSAVADKPAPRAASRRLTDVGVICRVVNPRLTSQKIWGKISCTKCTGQGNYFALITTVKQETRHSVARYLVINSRRSIIIAKLWRS